MVQFTLMQALTYLASVALVLGVLVFVHEFGHYAVAKLCGVRVEVFSLGFGKRLWGFRRGDTDYRISLLPLGGYVKMAGENPMEAHTGDPGEFTSHPRWQRFLIAIAGPTMNVILAVLVLAGVFMVHFEYPAFWKKSSPVAWIEAGSPAATAGILPGDHIAKLDGIQDPTWEQLEYQIALNPNQPLNVVIQRGSQVINTAIVPKTSGPDEIGYAGMVGEAPVIVDGVEPATPAQKAGLQKGDQLVAVNGSPIRAVPALSKYLEQTKNAPVDITIARAGKQTTLRITPELLPSESNSEKQYRIGALLGEGKEVGKLSFPKAFSRSLEECKTNSLLIFELMGKMIERKVSIKQMSGPIGITKISGEAAEQGFLPLLEVMALISLNLAVFNLLPIPILDGGLMLMLLIEGIMRRDIKQQVKERVYQVAFVFLLVFAAVVIYNDVAKTLPGHLL
jgi:regulator of sigma E protease